MTDLIYIDCETTGLDPDKHEVWEIAYAIEDGPIMSGVVEHSLRTADPFALELNGYAKRSGLFDVYGDPILRFTDPELKKMFKDATLVVANPTFDRMMLRARWGSEPWHYRSIDIESYSQGIFGWNRPKGMKDIRDEVVKHGYGVVVPDHSARKDVQALRSCYKALQEIQARYRYGYDEWIKERNAR